MEWTEIFQDGSIWELEKKDGKLLGYRTDYEVDEFAHMRFVDNGISTVQQRAKDMGLIFSEINFRGEEMKDGR